MSDLDDDDLGVDLTPLIDVTFMLVIFFIMTMSFALPNIELDLPEATTAERSAKDASAFILNVDAGGQFLRDKQVLTFAQVEALLKQGQFTRIELNLDKSAPAQALIDCADLARQYTTGQLQLNTLLKE